MRALVMLYKYAVGLPNGVLRSDAVAVRETADTLEVAERSGDDFTLTCARFVRGLTLVTGDGSQRVVGFELLATAREAALRERFAMAAVQGIDVEVAKEMVRTGDLAGAIEVSRAIVDDEFDTGKRFFAHRP